MNVGPFYFDIKEVFLILITILIGITLFFHINLFMLNAQALLTILILILITKGLLPAIHNEAFFILAVVALFLTLYLPVFQIVLFYFISFLLFRLLRVI